MAFEYEWWKYFLIPWIAGAVGYITNVRKTAEETSAPLPLPVLGRETGQCLL